MTAQRKPNEERHVTINGEMYKLEWDGSKGMWRSDLQGKWEDGPGEFMEFWLSEDAVNELNGGVPF